jgi:ribosomal protein S6--L-glutamate ligase
MENASRALDFTSFINEAKENGKVEILILSGNEKPSPTSKSFIEECEKQGMICNSVNVNNIKLEKVFNGHLIRVGEGEDQKEILIRPENTAIIPRRGVVLNTYTKQVMRDLEDARYFCVNSLESIEICESKYLTSEVLEAEGLPVPRYALITGEENLDQALEAVGGNFPVVLKLLSGTQGIGVSIVDSYASLKSVYQTIAKLAPENEILIQEKIDADYDLRIQIIVKKFDPINPAKDNCVLLGSMKREAVEKDFRTNYSLGGKVSGYEISDEIKDIACKAANAVGCHWCGVDIMIDSKDGKPYILEVNSSPGTEGISKAIGRPIVDDVIDYVADKDNWSYSKLEIGYLESIGIPTVGKMVAKFDTGNGSSACSIQADNAIEDDGFLLWNIGDSKFKSPIIGYTNTEVGRDNEKRPIIELDVMFDGALVKGVKVAPVNREAKSTPFLANRTLMKSLGVMVNPSKAFVISDQPEGYRPMKAKGEIHGGILFGDLEEMQETKEEDK